MRCQTSHGSRPDADARDLHDFVQTAGALGPDLLVHLCVNWIDRENLYYAASPPLGLRRTVI